MDERTTALRIFFFDSYKGPLLVKRGHGAVSRSSVKLLKEYLRHKR